LSNEENFEKKEGTGLDMRRIYGMMNLDGRQWVFLQRNKEENV